MIIDIQSNQDVDAISHLLAIRQQVESGAQSLRIGITSGCFDLFHHMHLTYLKRCRRLCDFLIVGVDSDDRVRRTKGELRPVITEVHRLAIIESLRMVDVAFIMDDLSQFELASKSFLARYIFRNQDWADKKTQVVGHQWAEVVIVPDTEQVNSTTEIMVQIQKRNIVPVDFTPPPLAA